MTDDREMVIRFLNMVRGSLDEKNTRLLEELRLKRLIALGPAPRDPAPETPQTPPPKPDHENPKRKTSPDTVTPPLVSPFGRARSIA